MTSLRRRKSLAKNPGWWLRLWLLRDHWLWLRLRLDFHRWLGLGRRLGRSELTGRRSASPFVAPPRCLQQHLAGGVAASHSTVFSGSTWVMRISPSSPRWRAREAGSLSSAHSSGGDLTKVRCTSDEIIGRPFRARRADSFSVANTHKTRRSRGAAPSATAAAVPAGRALR